MEKPRIFKCRKCGQIVIDVVDTNVPLVCCGEEMMEVIPGTVDAAQEKHVPVVEKNGANIHVKVGEVEHPSTEEHYIRCIGIFTKKGMARQVLNPGDKPEADFALVDGDEFVEAFADCNLHSV